jgi:GntR family transcriptional regulator
VTGSYDETHDDPHSAGTNSDAGRAPHDVRRVQIGSRIKAGRDMQNAPSRAHTLLRAGIRSGLIGQDELLIEDALVHTLGTSRNSVRAALQMLVDGGLISRAPRRGTEVVDDIVQFGLLDSSARVPGPVAAGEYTLTRLEARLLPAIGPVAHRLDAFGDEPIAMVEFLTVFAGKAVALRVSYHAPGYDPDAYERHVLSWEPRHVYDPLAPVVTETEGVRALYGVELGGVETSIEAQLSDQRTARLLDVAVGSPLIVRETLHRDAAGRPRALTYTSYDGNRVVLHHDQPRPAR